MEMLGRIMFAMKDTMDILLNYSVYSVIFQSHRFTLFVSKLLFIEN